MATVTYEEVKDVPNQPNTFVIDVRNKDELARTGVIPGAISVPMPDLEAAFQMSEIYFKTAFNRDKPSTETVLIFSCQAGGRAKRAYDLALANGYKNAKYYPGSWTEWAEKEGLNKA
ncbi:rhodanese domain-containing protein CG4456 [Zeugodacus cucurbitae]|uniref:rhodanese domain-containing protein CG4456 n=1 Tax=Zeugodacus cucurbitae TaxID=28588 RepID=UPI00059699DF|nr:rhodanese domain-containing protein CG4456 [Zeugodacus cucurbitae]